MTYDIEEKMSHEVVGLAFCRALFFATPSHSNDRPGSSNYSNDLYFCVAVMTTIPIPRRACHLPVCQWVSPLSHHWRNLLRYQQFSILAGAHRTREPKILEVD